MFNFHQEVESIFELKRSVFWTEMLEMGQTQLFFNLHSLTAKQQ